MLPWERMARERRERERMLRAAAIEEQFTPEILAKLTALRARFCGHPEWIEFTLEERRLVFARWLVEQGRLSDDIKVGNGEEKRSRPR